FFIDPPTTLILPLSLHDALPISQRRLVGGHRRHARGDGQRLQGPRQPGLVLATLRAFPQVPLDRPPVLDAQIAPVVVRAVGRSRDRKSTRLNSSHGPISYAAFSF